MGNNIVDSPKATRYTITECKAKSDFEYYLDRTVFYNRNTNLIIGAMSFQQIEGYFDASGKEESVSDTVIVVAGLLAEASQWRDFSNTWLEVLKQEKVPVGETLPVFHTTDFMAKREGYDDIVFWTEDRRQSLSNKLTDLMNSHALYPVGVAVIANLSSDLKRFCAKLSVFQKKK